MDVLKRALDLFNDILYKEKIPYSFNIDYRKYYIKPSKKTGKPDNDLPSKGN
jgi:hypothetical protein